VNPAPAAAAAGVAGRILGAMPPPECAVAPAPPPAPAQRCVRIEVRGTVQGVGFRPYVYRLATGLGLRGDVRNAGGLVVIRAGGVLPAVAAFLDRLPAEAPPAARIARVTAVEVGPARLPAGARFRVAASTRAEGQRAVTPDLATCAACLAELFDPGDRRHRYPFTTCSGCGPRATVIDDLPYDRARTTMARFPLCPECSREYHDPADRRFHAEPVACPECGPQLWWRAGAGPPRRREEALAAAVAVLAGGGLVAVKGIGGYQLICAAGDAAAVARTRAAKQRPAKPLAVMVADLPAARRLGELCAAEEHLLCLPARPIVLVRRAAAGAPATGPAAAGLPEVGLFLPASPLHHLLLAALAGPLVVTSGNRRGEPIAAGDGEAVRALGPLVDGVLGHDRPIRSRYDDSVARVVAGRATLIRRARGYAPEALPLPVPTPEPVLAVGAQLKHTVTVATGGRAVVGPHTGDLADASTLDVFAGTVRRLCRWLAVRPRLVAHDLHPGYLSTRFAAGHPAPGTAVQHHHAHVAAVAAEHGLAGPFLGVAYDGLGLGDDGTLWGGEVLLATYTGYRRLARFGRAPLPGGEAAVRRPARMALGYLYGAEDLGGPPPEPGLAADLLARLDPREVATVRQMVHRRLNSPVASSAGRLFDAVASLLGLCDQVSYEGEAAVRLEAAAAGHGAPPALPWRLAHRDGLCVYDPAPTLRALLEAGAGQPPGRLAAAFHTTLVEVTCALVAEAAERTGVRQVCLGGGVFANQRLTTELLGRLAGAGFEVVTGHRVPVNDGGISYGQAAVAAARLAEE
jgi:hydrogenase maturation protein HypF